MVISDILLKKCATPNCFEIFFAIIKVPLEKQVCQ